MDGHVCSPDDLFVNDVIGWRGEVRWCHEGLVACSLSCLAVLATIFITKNHVKRKCGLKILRNKVRVIDA